MKDIFDTHSSRFNHIFEVLHAPNGKIPFTIERRKFPRQTWEWNQPSLNVCLQDPKTAIRATICDFSREGLSLKLEDTNLPLLEEQVVILQGESPKESIAANFIMDHFLKKKKFLVRRTANELQPIIGLQAILESEKSNESNQNGRVLTSSPLLT
jgi:hypothetical protein